MRVLDAWGCIQASGCNGAACAVSWGELIPQQKQLHAVKDTMTSQLGVELLQPHSVCQIVLIFRDQKCRSHDDSYAPTHHPLNF